MRMALLSEKIQAMDAAQDAQVRQFSDPAFHFVPRQKMMQIQVKENTGGHVPWINAAYAPNRKTVRVLGTSLPSSHAWLYGKYNQRRQRL